MLKVLTNSRVSIRLCPCQLLPTKYIKSPKNQFHYPRREPRQRNIKLELHQLPIYASSNVLDLNILKRFYCTTVDLDDNPNEEVLEEILDELHEYLENNFTQTRDFLYDRYFVTDDLMAEISNCNSGDELLYALRNNVDKIGQHHAVLSLVKLWHCKSLKFKSPAKIIDEGDAFGNDENFSLLLTKISQYAGQMTPDELTVCFLYLTKLSVNMRTEVMETVLEHILTIIKNGDSTNISLSALSRFAVAVNLNKQLYTNFICQNILPHILYHLERVTESKDLQLITICLSNIDKLVSSDLLDLFKQKVHEFIVDDKMKDDTKTILKILQYLSVRFWLQDHLPLLRMLVLQLKDKLDTLHIRQLAFIGYVFQSNFEPAAIGSAMEKYAFERLEQQPTAEVLAATVLHASPEKRIKLTALAKEFVFSNSRPDSVTLTSLYKIIRLLKISNPSICNEYWSKVKHQIISNPSLQENYILAKYCHRYMHFNNNLNGTYRFIPFEKAIVKLIVNDLDKGITAILPSKFAKAASFIMSYGHTPHDKYKFPEFIIRKLEDMQEQFTIFDCLQLTRGIQIALEMRFKQEMHPELASQITRLDNVFNACSERHLEQPNLCLNDLNRIVRSYINRKSTKRTSIYRKIIEKYETIPHHPLTSRIIRDITYNLNVAKYKIPSLCDSLNDYVINNHEYIMGDTVEKVLYCFYNLNYYPKDEKIFKYATEIVYRDFDFMSGLAIVKACLSLAFYKELPGPLIERVFNISFIQRIEDEIEMCYSKENYPQRVFNAVMQLNRAVCLDFPEHGVPWFQQNYIEAQLTKLPLVKNNFFNDVKNMLTNFTNDASLLKVDHVTPYGYRIDFVLYFDKNKKILKPPTLEDTVTQTQINKVAIILMNSDKFCQNDFEHVRGREALKERHLEMMGFKVIQINYSQWNSMYMNLPGAKDDYIRSLLS